MPERAPQTEAKDEKALLTRAGSLKMSLTAVAAPAGDEYKAVTPGLAVLSESVSTVALASCRRREFMAATPSIESPEGLFTMLTMEMAVLLTESRAAQASRT